MYIFCYKVQKRVATKLRIAFFPRKLQGQKGTYDERTDGRTDRSTARSKMKGLLYRYASAFKKNEWMTTALILESEEGIYLCQTIRQIYNTEDPNQKGEGRRKFQFETF